MQNPHLTLIPFVLMYCAFYCGNFKENELYTQRIAVKSRCLNFTRIDESREDNKEPKAYSLKLFAKRNTNATPGKLQDGADAGRAREGAPRRLISLSN